VGTRKTRVVEDDASSDKMPIQVYGSDIIPLHQKHISDAMHNPLAWENGQTEATYRGPNNRHSMSWMPLSCNDGYVRDEYPYASTDEGGEANRKWVSLRCLPESESSLQGGFNSAFVRGTRLRMGDQFLVITVDGATTGF